MNFLSHFYHELPCDNAYFACGVILPDILSNYSSRSGEIVKIHPGKIVDSDNGKFQAISEGIRQHHFVDGFFHDSDFFSKNTNTIDEVIRKYTFSCFERRLFAFNHVLLELMLDRKILLEEQKVCNQMYALLDQVEPEILEDFIRLNSQSREPRKVTQHYLGFCSHRFVYDYIQNNVLINILNRINQRLGNPVFSATDNIHLTSVIYDIEKRLLPQKFPKFLPES
ncbi:MAG: hypothetical protein ACKVPJ_11380 [Chitinophagales bacterium]